MTAITLAAAGGHGAVVARLLAAGANGDKETPLPQKDSTPGKLRGVKRMRESPAPVREVLLEARRPVASQP
jgi:hypothetical protein